MERKWRWVSRDKRAEMVDIVSIYDGESMPVWCERNQWFTSAEFFDMNHAGFMEMFGIDIQPGQCVKVEFTAKVIEDGTP